MEKLNLLFNQLINDIQDEEEHDNLLNYLNNYMVQKNELKNKNNYYNTIINNLKKIMYITVNQVKFILIILIIII